MSLDALKALEDRIDKAVGTIGTLKKEKDRLEAENKRLKGQVEDLTHKLKSLEEQGGDLETLRQENRQLKGAQEGLRDKLESIIGKLEKFQD